MRGFCPPPGPIGCSRSKGVMRLTCSIVLVATAILASATVFALTRGHASGPAALRPAIPDLVELPAGTFRHRSAGEFSRNDKPVTAPLVTITIKRPLAIMRHQVTAADYQRCVEAGACPTVDQDGAVPDIPVVNVSWRDAHAYASWLSRETGERFGLPTDEEWAYAAAGQFHDDALPEGLDVSDPGQRALAIYDREASRQERFDQAPRAVGSFGANENGLLDMAGNVWEWTRTCYARTALDTRGEVAAAVVNCGVRVVEGRHRTFMADFIRDARAGGCSIGTPPSNLGFRLVREGDPRRAQRLLLVWVRRLVSLRI
jgi:formylglycine-generating enzyme required for sulfatase activity